MEKNVSMKKAAPQGGRVREAAREQFTEGAPLRERLSTLNDIMLLIDDAEGKEEILSIIRSEAPWVMKFQACFVALLNRSRTHYEVRSLSPVADSSDIDHQHFSIEEGIPGVVMRSRIPVVTTLTSGPEYAPALEGRLQDLGMASLLAVPMLTGNDTTGCMVFGGAEASQKAFAYFDVTVFLLDEQRKSLILEAHSGSYGDFLPHGYTQNVGEGIVGWVAANGEKILCNDVTRDPRYITYSYHDTRSELALPIRVDGQVAAVLNVEDRKLYAFDDTDAVVLETLCEQLGSAMKNAFLYEEVQHANVKLVEPDRMKSEFLGIVSHDFRSPLSSIILAGKALLKHEDVQRVKRFKDYLQIIVDQANRLNQLAEDTLSITKIESGKLSYYFKIVNVERLIQDAVSMVRISRPRPG